MCMRKKLISLVILLCLCFIPLMAKITLREDLFSSDEELKAFKAEEVTESDRAYFENMRIYLLVGGPGSAIWENFGHSAFVIERDGYHSIAFDYGIFTFNETFIPNFILGKLYYEVWETYAQYRINSLENDDRSVYLLPLDLDANQKKALYSFLVYNTEEENKTYLYDYFADNCATRLRDIYSYATNGDFEEYLRSKEADETIRDSVSRYLSRSTFFTAWAINYLLGPSVDGAVSEWEMCYLPDNLIREIEEYESNTREVLYESKGRSKTPERWSLGLRATLFGLILGAISVFTSLSKHHKVGDFILGVVYTLFGIMSLVLAFLAFFTIHNVTHNNMHILIISPICIVAGVLHFVSLSKKGRREKAIILVNGIMFTLALLTVAARLILSSILIQNIWATATVALILYSSEVIPYVVKKRKLRA